MKKCLTLPVMLMISCAVLFAQKGTSTPAQLERPKLVVGIVVDQMRWDYLYRFYNKYENGGFKRLLNEGFACQNTMLNYIPSVTAIGHTTIFTGSVPSIHGIAGNDWIDDKTGKSVYCTDDPTENSVGTESKAGKMSPRKLLASTITDELRIATNFQSKVVGVSLKDRASIIPAGHNPTGAFWMDDATGRFITSTYYMKELPAWVNAFNESKPIDKLLANGWNTLLPINEYTESTADDVSWEGILKGASKPVFPYDVKKAYELDHGTLRQMPFGNTLTLQFARAAIDGYKLGQEKSCDFLTINCASTDYSGHLVGPNAIEIEDVYLRLDRDLAGFFSYLDQKIGKGNYLVFLTADHGAANAEGFLESNKMPTGFLSKGFDAAIGDMLKQKFGDDKLVTAVDNFQVYFNKARIDSLNLDFDKIKATTVDFLIHQDGIQYAADQDKISTTSIPAIIKEMMINGYNQQRSGSVVMITKPGWLPYYSKTGTTHSVWNPYDTHIPLIFMGWKVQHGFTTQTTHMTDISATVAALLHIQMPNGCIGQPIISICDK
ncbi:MAG: alkaline phosphatase family protein [Hungatella sp.]|nr:alkaline phosphatase family protein [Hungatella sp.]MTK06588.1 alkaline phosphatase family protein [Hungatella sp.]